MLLLLQVLLLKLSLGSRVWHTVSEDLLETGSGHRWLPAEASPGLRQMRCLAWGARWHMVGGDCNGSLVYGSSFPPLGRPGLGCSIWAEVGQEGHFHGAGGGNRHGQWPIAPGAGPVRTSPDLRHPAYGRLTGYSELPPAKMWPSCQPQTSCPLCSRGTTALAWWSLLYQGQCGSGVRVVT